MISLFKRVMNSIDSLVNSTFDSDLKSFESLIKAVFIKANIQFEVMNIIAVIPGRRISYSGRKLGVRLF